MSQTDGSPPAGSPPAARRVAGATGRRQVVSGLRRD
jgi:hypothetical protein